MPKKKKKNKAQKHNDTAMPPPYGFDPVRRHEAAQLQKNRAPCGEDCCILLLQEDGSILRPATSTPARDDDSDREKVASAFQMSPNTLPCELAEFLRIPCNIVRCKSLMKALEVLIMSQVL
jgi:hypothetical protein